jgi:hypothetical protein
LVIFATLLAACDLSSSYVQRTRVTAGGGEYTLFASDPQRVPAGLVTNECPPGRVCGLSQAECDSY